VTVVLIFTGTPQLPHEYMFLRNKFYATVPCGLNFSCSKSLSHNFSYHDASGSLACGLGDAGCHLWLMWQLYIYGRKPVVIVTWAPLL